MSSVFLFFKQKTAYELRISDGSSDVCSSELHLVFLAHAQDAGEGADIHGEIDRQIDQDAAHALFGAGGKADQRIADMADRGIGHQPLDVALGDGRKGTENHAEGTDHDDDLLPFTGDLKIGRASCRERVCQYV